MAKNNITPPPAKKFYIALLFMVFWFVFLGNVQYSRWGENNRPGLYNVFLVIFYINALVLLILAFKNIYRYLKY